GKFMENIIDNIKWTSGNWDVRGHGNHRAKILVEDCSNYNELIMKWRRGDKDPETRFFIIEYENGRQIEPKDYLPVDINNDFAHIVFNPACGKGIYYIYYLAFEDYGDYTDQYKMKYNDELFVPTSSVKEAYKHNNLPKAKCIEIQYRETVNHKDFHNFYPMEVIATFDETVSVKKKYKKEPFLPYFEDAYHPIKMTDNIPYRWTEKEPNTSIEINAGPNEYKVFQLGLFATKCDLENIKVNFTIDKDYKVTCFNTEGIDYKGDYFTKEISVKKNKVQALWFGIDLPKDGKDLKGNIEVSCNGEKVIIPVSVKVSGEPIEDRFDDMYSMSRIAWLNDTAGNEDYVVKPYKEVEAEKNKISILDRDIELNQFALPKSITSRDLEILSDEISFDCGENVNFISFEMTEKGKSFVKYKSLWESDKFTGETKTEIECDGCVNIGIKLKAKDDFEFNNILQVPLRKEIATYLMGYGKQGGYRTKDIDWKWKVDQRNNMVWIGDVDAGLYVELRDTKDTFDMYYNTVWGNPHSWWNEGLGGSKVFEKEESVFVYAYSGDRDFEKNSEIEFNIRLLVTPFHKIDPNHWDYTSVYEGKNKDANYAHQHHACKEYPFINYPLFYKEELKKKFDNYKKDFKGINIYNTVRELTTHLPELPMFASLGEEIYEHEHTLRDSQKKAFLSHYGGETPWVREHIHFKCHPEYMAIMENGTDASIHTNGLSRLANFYAKGIEYGMKYLGYDGVYIDSINTDRRTMKRIARILEKEYGYHRINYHGFNFYNLFNVQVSPALTCMEHFAYFTSLWLGEEFEYDLKPDYWLVEVSGIPFGLTSEELYFDNVLNEYRGMIFGMGSKIYDNASAIWNFWKEYKIEESEMIGYWEKDCPVRTNKSDVYVTCYKKDKEVLIAVATWSGCDEKVKLDIDYKALGIDKEKAKLILPYIKGFQDSCEYETDHEFVIKPAGGFMAVLKETD
ncbi:MAG: hypothetical protein KBT47_02300, partial [Armatimonadetes bacterium]|nr:hypothetical protein [Candidatus Hippobium faecium]